MKYFILIPFISLYAICSSQQTVGAFINDDSALPSLTLFSPFRGTDSYLIDNCGRLVNRWDRAEFVGLSAYFLENGLLLRTIQVGVVQGPFFSQSNGGAVELVDWENNAVWRYNLNTDTTLSHHDVKYMPNGHILMLGWETMDQGDLLVLGRDPGLILSGNHNLEYIIEVEPDGELGGDILWEWHLKDHLIQESNNGQNNFGVVSEHPELIDINFQADNFDWTHVNAIDYNESLDQILLSVRNFSEVWILDHSTTIEEAKGHTGGLSGKGGDILYRWGNPQVYDRGDDSDRKLYNQHGVNWITSGLRDEGKIMIFNNGFGRDYSTVEVIDPPVNDDGHYLINPDIPFGPDNAFYTYGEKGIGFNSLFLSNAQRLPNGHTFVNEGGDGHLFELNEQDEIVWDYINPVRGDFVTPQGLNPNGPLIFRSYKYALDYPGFDGLDLTPGELLEGDSEYNICETVTANDDRIRLPVQWVYDNHQIILINAEASHIKGYLYEMTGKLIHTINTNQNNVVLDLPHNSDGIIFLTYSVDSTYYKTTKLIYF